MGNFAHAVPGRLPHAGVVPPREAGDGRRRGTAPRPPGAKEGSEMLPHPDTACVLATMDRRQLLAASARARRVAEAASVGDQRVGRSSGVAHLRQALVDLARRRSGTRPAVPDGAAAPAL